MIPIIVTNFEDTEPVLINAEEIASVVHATEDLMRVIGLTPTFKATEKINDGFTPHLMIHSGGSKMLIRDSPADIQTLITNQLKDQNKA